MTEQEWAASDDPQKMRQHLEDVSWANDRRLRLFVVACCRRVEPWLASDVQRAAVDALERLAEGVGTPRELEVARATTGLAPNPDAEADWGGDIGDDDLDVHVAARATLSRALWADAPEYDRWAFYHRLHDFIAAAVETAGHAAVAADPVNGRELPARAAERRVLANLLRCLVGNPFRPPPPFDPAWRTHAAVALAEAAYEERAWEGLPILADALADAGCEEEAILGHLRGRGPHARGCWVVDGVLGRG